jgi:hypothetical protein
MTTELFLCEGKWDLKLLKKYLSKKSPRSSPEYFKMESVDKNQRGIETDKIRDLKNEYHPTDILVKSENGRKFFKRTYAASIMTFVEASFDLKILCDFDHNGIDRWVNDVNEKVEGKYTTPVETSVHRQKFTSDSVSSYIMNIEINNEVKKQFGLVGFETKMEEAAGIDKGIHDRSDNERLVGSLSEEDNFNRAADRVML